MKYIVGVAAALFMLTTGCFKTSFSPAQDVRPVARAATDLAKDAWVLAATACLDAANAAGDDAIRAKCEKVLTPAHDLIAAAAEAVDTSWTDGAACDLLKATGMVVLATKDFSQNGIGPTIADAAKIAATLTSAACTQDAGSE